MKLLLVLVVILLLILFIKTPKPFPVFNSLRELEQSDEWRNYFLKVYKELPPEEDFPIDIGDFWVLYHQPSSIWEYLKCPTKKGEIYKDMSISHDPPNTSWIYHPPPFKALEGLIEVTHCSDSGAIVQEETGMWMYHAPGSGIYFDLGRTISFPDHSSGVEYFLHKKCDSWSLLHGNTECVNDFDAMVNEAKKEYDSIQFLNHGDMKCGNMAIEIIGLYHSGSFPCGNQSGTGIFRSGWKGSRDCVCDTKKLCLNCDT
jgi:hypothetical protein